MNIFQIQDIKNLGVIASAALAMLSMFVMWPKISKRIKSIREKMRGTTEIKAMIGEMSNKMEVFHRDLNNGIVKATERIDLISSRQVSDDFSNDTAGIFETNKAGEFKIINREFIRLSGLTETEASGNGWINMIAPEHRKSVEGHWNDAVGHDRNFEIDTVILKSGQRMKARIRAFKMIDAEGETLGYRGRLNKLN